MTDCPRSHLYLREILPRLKDRLHDIIEGTRIAMMDLLLVRLQWDLFLILVQCPELFLCITIVRQLNTQVLDYSGNLITKHVWYSNASGRGMFSVQIYRELTRLRYQSFDNCLEDEPRVGIPINQSLLGC